MKNFSGFAGLIAGALFILFLSSCQATSPDRTLRLGVSSATAVDPEGSASTADLNRTLGGEIQISSGGLVVFAHGSQDDSQVLGTDDSLTRASLGIGAEVTYGDGPVRAIGQLGIMASSLTADVRTFERTEAEAGVFIGLGAEADLAPGVSLFILGRPLEPSVNFEGNDLDSRSLLFGIGLSF